MNAEVKPGYKLTEVGVIPEDWEVKPVGELVLISVGRDLIEAHYSYYQDGVFQYPVFSNTVDNKGLYGFYSIYEYNGESLTVVGRGVGLGTAFKRKGRYGAIGRLLVLFPKPNIDATFLTEYINHRVKIFFESGGIPQLTGMSIAKYRIPIPPTKAEQESIAEALSDADALIESLEQLITKKRQIKQGAMQELLTGKKRLPGFSGEWEVKRLGDVVKISKGQLITEKNAISGEIPVIAGGKKPAYFHNKPNRTGKTITVSASGASAGYVAFFDEPIFASDCSTISEGNDYSIEFIYSQLLLKQDIIYKAQTGGAQPHIHAVDLMPIEIGVPTFSEQQAIAIILFDMDAEIDVLEGKLGKALQLKQGMMHNLLTGKIRVV